MFWNRTMRLILVDEPDYIKLVNMLDDDYKCYQTFSNYGDKFGVMVRLSYPVLCLYLQELSENVQVLNYNA